MSETDNNIPQTERDWKRIYCIVLAVFVGEVLLIAWFAYGFSA